MSKVTLNGNNYVSETDFESALGICKMFYDRMIDSVGFERAYNWAHDNIDEYWRDRLGIKEPRKYKSVSVGLSLELIVPENWSTSDIVDYAVNLPLDETGNLMTVVTTDEISQDDVEGHMYDYAFNNPLEFKDEDFGDY